MRLVLIASLLATACSDDPPSGPSIDSHVQFYEWPGYIPMSIDMLFVVENTAAMTAFQSGLATIPPLTADFFFGSSGQMPDARFAVTTADGTGTLRQPTSTTDAYVASTYDDRFTPSNNFTGTFTDALTQMMNVGTSSAAAVQPLASAKAALDAHPDFVREAGFLGIILLTAGDDASTGAVADFAADLKGRKPDTALVFISGAHDLPVTRLQSFYDQFPNRSSIVDIASTDVAGVATFQGGLRTVIGVGCYPEPADVDAVTAGKQYDCDLNMYWADGTTEPIRQCVTGGTERCFEFTTVPGECRAGPGDPAVPALCVPLHAPDPRPMCR